MEKKYFIFGTSSGAEEFVSNFTQEDFNKIIGFLDNNEEKIGNTFFDKPICSPKELNKFDFDKIIIASSFFKEIKQGLLDLGIDENKITTSIKFLNYDNLKQLEFILETENKLKNKNISLVTNNCFAIYLYRILNLQFYSPFIGVSIDYENNLKLLNNFNYYISQPLKVIFEEETDAFYGFLDDVKIKFPHYHSAEIISEYWARRIERLNLNNMFIIHTYKDLSIEEKAADKLAEKINNLIVIEKEHSYIYQNHKKIVTDKEIDFIKWFNKEI